MLATLTSDRHFRQFAKYVIVGLATTALNFAVYVVLLYLGVHYLPAAVVAFVTATLNSYTFNRIWTYRAGAHTHIRLAKFATIQIIGLSVNLAVLATLVEQFDVHKLLAQLVANGCVVMVTFLGNKLWTFRG
jgi:putative flippase GtrA